MSYKPSPPSTTADTVRFSCQDELEAIRKKCENEQQRNDRLRSFITELSKLTQIGDDLAQTLQSVLPSLHERQH